VGRLVKQLNNGYFQGQAANLPEGKQPYETWGLNTQHIWGKTTLYQKRLWNG
jgi:hypothetical protein